MRRSIHGHEKLVPIRRHRVLRRHEWIVQGSQRQERRVHALGIKRFRVCSQRRADGTERRKVGEPIDLVVFLGRRGRCGRLNPSGDLAKDIGSRGVGVPRRLFEKAI